MRTIYTEHRKTLLSSHKLSLTLEGGTVFKYRIQEIEGHLDIDVSGVSDPVRLDLSEVSRLETRLENE